MSKELSQKELLQSQNTVSEQNNSDSLPKANEQLVEITDHEGSGLKIVGNPIDGYFAAVGRFAVTEKGKKFEEVKAILDSFTKGQWEIIFGLLGATVQEFQFRLEVIQQKLKDYMLADTGNI